MHGATHTFSAGVRFLTPTGSSSGGPQSDITALSLLCKTVVGGNFA